MKSSLTSEERLDHLVRFGYFPKELPFGFTTESFADKINELPNLDAVPKRGEAFQLGVHSFSKYGLNRRILGLVNPKPFLGSSQVVARNWKMFEDLNRSSISLSKPRFSKQSGSQRRALGNDSEHRLAARLDIRSVSRFLLEADVMRFFPSIYTHSIAWAIEGKEKAKQFPNDDTLVGNQLDRWVQAGQYKQTVGIPIGNDVSVVISESILACVDKKANLSRSKKAVRWVDDYEICSEEMREAEAQLASLITALRDFELDVNDRKTRIVPLPIPIEDNWIPPLRRFEIRSGNRQVQDLVSFFDLAFESHLRDGSRHALKFAIGRLLYDEPVEGDTWPVLQKLIMQAVVADPGVLPQVGLLLKRYLNRSDYELDTELVEEGLNLQLRSSLRNYHDSEIAWSIWALCNLDLTLKKQNFSEFVRLRDSISAVLLLNAIDTGVVKSKMDLGFLTQHFPRHQPNSQPGVTLAGGGMAGNMWLLLYEAHVHDWTNTLKVGKSDGNWEDFFKAMLAKQVSFFQPSIGLASLERELQTIEEKILGYRSAHIAHRTTAAADFADIDPE